MLQISVHFAVIYVININNNINNNKYIFYDIFKFFLRLKFVGLSISYKLKMYNYNLI